jgi:tRNA(fMet)-specific endonuclease VapC
VSDASFMLDTNIVSDLVRNPGGRAFQTWQKKGFPDLCISAIVTSELYFGIEKRQSDRLSRGVEEVLARVSILPYENPSARVYGRLRSTAERSGKIIGPVDLFIAAHALSLDMTLVTNNIREFSRVDGLKLENWLEETP